MKLNGDCRLKRYFGAADKKWPRLHPLVNKTLAICLAYIEEGLTSLSKGLPTITSDFFNRQPFLGDGSMEDLGKYPTLQNDKTSTVYKAFYKET